MGPTLSTGQLQTSIQSPPLRYPLGSSGQGHLGVYAVTGGLLSHPWTRGTHRVCSPALPQETALESGFYKRRLRWCVTGHPHLGVALSPCTSLAPSHDNIGRRGGEEAPSSRSGSRSPISCPRSHTPALVSTASSLKGRTVPPGYRAFPTELEAESATRPSGNQRLTGKKEKQDFCLKWK